MTELEYLSIEKDGDISIVTIDREEKLNSLNSQVLQELGAVFTELSREDNLRGVILTGKGRKSFVAGADLEELADLNKQSGRDQSKDREYLPKSRTFQNLYSQQ
jgi:enoyl-CoA hydratase